MHRHLLAPKPELFTEQPGERVLKELRSSTELWGDSFEVSLVLLGPQRDLSMGKIRIRRTENDKPGYVFPDRSQVFSTLGLVNGEDEWYNISVIIQMGEDLVAQPARIVVDPLMAKRLIVA